MIDRAIQLSDRRINLCKHPPSCPACEEQDQIQLMDWLNVPARWRCRVCGHKWADEPE